MENENNEMPRRSAGDDPRIEKQLEEIRYYARRTSSAVTSYIEMRVRMTTSSIISAVIIGIMAVVGGLIGTAAGGAALGAVAAGVLMLITWASCVRDYRHRDDPPTRSSPADIDRK